MKLDQTSMCVLMATRILLSDRASFTKGVSARDMFGNPVPSHDVSAVKWCLAGALIATTWDALPKTSQGFPRLRLAQSLDALLRTELKDTVYDPPDCLGDFNDLKGWKSVLYLLDSAITHHS